MSEHFITADHHFGHRNIIQYCQRPFRSAAEMDAAMIENWNRVVKPNDVVWHLGDFTLGPWEIAKKYFRQLNGDIYIVRGEHDWRWYQEYLTNAPAGVWFKSDDDESPCVGVQEIIANLKRYGEFMVLCHWPMRSWQRSFHGSIHFHGHSHGKSGPWRNSIDVGVDSHNFTPLKLRDAIQLAKDSFSYDR